VLVTLIAAGDPKTIERLAREDPDRSKRIVDHAKSHGLIAHRFYGSEGKCMVIDEWPDPEDLVLLLETTLRGARRSVDRDRRSTEDLLRKARNLHPPHRRRVGRCATATASAPAWNKGSGRLAEGSVS
jgi:hypothetical protein